MCAGHGGGGGGGGMGAAEAAVLHEGLRVPMSGQSIQSKYFYLMENMCTKVNNVCMYECMHAY